jgi:protein TonB
MSDPTPDRPVHDDGLPPGAPPPRERHGASLLLWLLLLLVVIATAWYFLGREDPQPTAPAPVQIGEPVREESRSPVSVPPDSRDATARERAASAPRLPDRNALPLNHPAPEYPEAARRAGEEGTVVLEVEVGADGRPGEITISRRSGSRDLDRAAVDAVRGWTFEPAIRDGKPVASTVQVPVDFRIANR